MKISFSLPCLLIASVVTSLSIIGCKSDAVAANPEEVGTVTWGRDFDSALVSAKKTGKPVFLLFQEIPGCAGCKRFGHDVLSDPDTVSMIEQNFTPLLIHNNKPGRDADVLEKFNEPAWNYQVVRFLDASGRELIPRKEKVWDSAELKERMKLALEKAGRPVKAAAATCRVAIAQPCFWSGEMKIGAIDGVKRTEAGYLNGKEVTLVDYEPDRLSLQELTRKAKAEGVATQVFTEWNSGYQKAPDFDQKRQLQGTKYEKIKLTPEQATKVNAFIRTSPQRVEEFLSAK